MNPQLQDLAIEQAYTAWRPGLIAGLSAQSQDSPPSSFLSGASDKITSTSSGGNVGVTQLLRWGTSYAVSYDTNRFTTNNVFSSFNPQFGADLDVAVVQPLLRGFRFDNARYQLLASPKEPGDRRRRPAADIGADDAQREERVLGIQVRAGLARRRPAVARPGAGVAPQHAHARGDRHARPDRRHRGGGRGRAARGGRHSRGGVHRPGRRSLRSLVFDPNTPDFWTMRLEPTDPVPFQVQAVDVAAAITRALAERTDLQQSKKSIERSAYAERFFKNQTLPARGCAGRLQLDRALAARSCVRGEGAFPPPVIGEVAAAVQRPAQRRLRQRLPDLARVAERHLPDRAEHSRRLARAHAPRNRGSRRRTSAISSCRSPRRCATPRGSWWPTASAWTPRAHRGCWRNAASRPRRRSSRRACPRASWCSRPSATCRRPATRSCAPCSTTRKSQVDFETVQIAPVTGASGFTSSAAVGHRARSVHGGGAAGRDVGHPDDHARATPQP